MSSRRRRSLRPLTDEEARERFRGGPRASLLSLAEGPEELTPVEMEALSSVDPELLDRFADLLDPRLQRILVPRPDPKGGCP